MTGLEITPSQAADLRRAGLPNGTQIVEVEDVPWAGRSFRPNASGLLLPSRDLVAEMIAEAERPKPVAVELFTGAGGFSLGIHAAGFDVIAGVEWDAAAAFTYLSNLGHPDCAVFVDAEYREANYQDAIGGRQGAVQAPNRHRVITAEARLRDIGCRLAETEGP